MQPSTVNVYYFLRIRIFGARKFCPILVCRTSALCLIMVAKVSYTTTMLSAFNCPSLIVFKRYRVDIPRGRISSFLKGLQRLGL